MDACFDGGDRFVVDRLGIADGGHERFHGWAVAGDVAPDLDDGQIRDLSRAFLDGGLDGLIATNTTIERGAVEGHPRADEAGGLSGAPLTSRATEVIAAFHAELGERIPIIGVGGIMSGDDALAKIEAGARLVQVYTGFIYRGPGLLADILGALSKSAEGTSKD